jgi:hypothetical protein
MALGQHGPPTKDSAHSSQFVEWEKECAKNCECEFSAGGSDGYHGSNERNDQGSERFALFAKFSGDRSGKFVASFSKR